MLIATPIKSPLEISNCISWYDASDNSVLLSNGGVVTGWYDKGSASQHIIAATTENAPKVDYSNFSNQQSLLFTGGTSGFKTSPSVTFSNTSQWTVFCVAKTNNAYPNEQLVISYGNYANAGFGIEFNKNRARLKKYTGVTKPVMIDDITLGSVTIGNFSFETPSVGASNSQARPAGASWDFYGAAGVVDYRHTYLSYHTCPDGIQAGYLGNTSHISQSINIPTGTYTLGYYYVRQYDAAQTVYKNISVYLNRDLIDYEDNIVTSNFASKTSSAFNITSSGNYILSFHGDNDLPSFVNFNTDIESICVANYNNGNSTIYGNGIAGDSDANTYGDGTPNFIYVGGFNNFSSFKGSIAEIIIFSRQLSATEQRMVEWYLARKWRINVS